jgi:nanoRNase/pAp phosphatase (c-di-AMP/oligoRNAs hydrolase)
VDAYLWLLVRANKRLLAQIIHPKVSRYYFVTVGRALNSAFFYRNVIGARLGDVAQADVIAQTADLLLTHERMTWAICTGFVGDQMVVSARSSNGKANLGRLMRKLVAKKGTAGGHELTAGAQIDCRDLVPAERIRLEEGLVTDFIRLVTHQKNVDPKPLLPRS